MWEYVGIAVVGIICLLGVAMTVVRLPGPWLIAFCGLGFAWYTDWSRIGARGVIALVAAAVAGEVIEFFASAVVAKRAGASKAAGWAGLIGGVLGMFFLTFLVPIPLVGSVIGAMVGCFGGAMMAEWWVRKRIERGARVGFASVVGFVLGMMTKTLIAFGMAAGLVASVVANLPAHPDIASR